MKAITLIKYTFQVEQVLFSTSFLTSILSALLILICILSNNIVCDFIQVEIMMFTVGNIPKLSEDGRALKPGDAFLQHVLVKTLLKVC